MPTCSCSTSKEVRRSPRPSGASIVDAARNRSEALTNLPGDVPDCRPQETAREGDRRRRFAHTRSAPPSQPRPSEGDVAVLPGGVPVALVAQQIEAAGEADA